MAQCQTGKLYADFYVLNGTESARVEIKDSSGNVLATLFAQDGKIVGAIIHAMGNEVLNPEQLSQYGGVCSLLDKVQNGRV